MIRFCKTFYADGLQVTTFFESCGVADLITTCYGGRNRKVSEAFVKTGKPIDVLEKEMLNGQKLQGYQTCDEVVKMLTANGHTDRMSLNCSLIESSLKKTYFIAGFPLFVAVDLIYKGQLQATQLIDYLRQEPDE